jgi:hypothetical protein
MLPSSARVCQHENTSNGDLLIDRHPDHDNVWLVGGGSGTAARTRRRRDTRRRLVLTGDATHPRFSLATKGHARRTRGVLT